MLQTRFHYSKSSKHNFLNYRDVLESYADLVFVELNMALIPYSIAIKSPHPFTAKR